MKIILSRKGFDSDFGKGPSPILPDGTLLSLPVPPRDPRTEMYCFSDLKLNDNKTYFDIVKELGYSYTIDARCHLDPDLCSHVILRKKGWRPLFGQASTAQTHLENNGIKEGDIFLFFGWFRRTHMNLMGRISFIKNDPGRHIIFGYLQVEQIIEVGRGDKVFDWAKYHPHANVELRGENKRTTNNTIYVARETLSWDNEKPGAATLKCNDNLVLTKEGYSRSKWKLPEFFKEIKISYHNPSCWKNGYFQSVGRGQEFVIGEDSRTENWAKKLIHNSEIIGK